MSRVIHRQSSSMLFRPDAHHRSVGAVLGDRKLSSEEKRAILSSWASDMFAVESAPALRMIPGHSSPIRLRDILDALRSLDDDPPPRGGAAASVPGSRIGIDTDDAADAVPATGLPLGSHQNEALRVFSMRAHQNNVRRYRRLLETDLTELERRFVIRRLAEERSALRALAKTSGGTDAHFSLAAGY